MIARHGDVSESFECTSLMRLPDVPSCHSDSSSALWRQVGVMDNTDATYTRASTLDIAQLRSAIPKHCFNSSTWRSTSHVVLNIAAIFVLFVTALSFSKELLGPIASIILWVTYTYLQGLMFTGVWVLAHECGHGALYRSTVANDLLGFVLHSVLVVPYWSWKYTHARHHRYASHLEKDTAFVPTRTGSQSIVERIRHGFGMLGDQVEDAPMLVLSALLVHQLVGLPAYLLTYATGPRNDCEKSTPSHFNPWSSLFVEGQRGKILLSTGGVAVMLFCLAVCSSQYGLAKVALLYGLPYLWMNHWIGAREF